MFCNKKKSTKAFTLYLQGKCNQLYIHNVTSCFVHKLVDNKKKKKVKSVKIKNQMQSNNNEREKYHRWCFYVRAARLFSTKDSCCTISPAASSSSFNWFLKQNVSSLASKWTHGRRAKIERSPKWIWTKGSERKFNCQHSYLNIPVKYNMSVKD